MFRNLQLYPDYKFIFKPITIGTLGFVSKCPADILSRCIAALKFLHKSLNRDFVSTQTTTGDYSQCLTEYEFLSGDQMCVNGIRIFVMPPERVRRG